MIEWLKGSSRPTDVQHAFGGEGATFLDDAPETPAPLFAVRAFKTAIFGTPKPIQYKAKTVEPQQPTQQQSNEDNVKEEPELAQVTPQKNAEPPKIAALSQETLTVPQSAPNNRLDQWVSPTKGILLTPGTAATRRKTVSFSARKEFRERTTSPDNAVELESRESAKKNLGPGPASEPQRKQSALTKTLIELSTKRLSPPAASTQSATVITQNLNTERITEDSVREPFSPSEPVVDVTIDLSQPRSRSGQHWKAEYDEYHKNSTRELKKIIQHGQNVKSYAVKKDYEATSLNEKLQKELAKVVRMEAKVSKLARQLKMASAKGPEGESEQARLVGELAQQSAMVVRYQRKAEQYRKALRRRSSKEVMDEQSKIMDESLVEEGKGSQHSFEVATLQAQLESLQETATAAENRASRLEIENRQLKRNLARVKEEMMSYDSRRQAREERLQKREERHKASKEKCEAELAKLKAERQRLLQASQVHGKDLQQSVPPARNFLISDEAVKMSKTLQDTKESASPIPTTAQNQSRQPSLSPRKRRSQKLPVDIWTLPSPNNPIEQQPSVDIETTELAPSSVKHDIDRALHEINQNLIASKPNPQSPPATGPESPTHTENVWPSTKPSPKRDIANDLVTVPSFRQLHRSTVGRSASLLSHRLGSRTSTMGSARTSALSAERTAAAKARLAERKKSAEKKKRKDRVGNLG